MAIFDNKYGVFKIGGREVQGRIFQLDGVVTVEFFSQEFFSLREESPDQVISGYTSDNVSISLIDPIWRSGPGQKTDLRSGRSLCFWTICPRYIVQGAARFQPEESSVTQLEIHHESFNHLFHDPSRVKIVIDAEKAIEILEREGAIEKEEESSNWRSAVYVFKDKGRLASFETIFGHIEVYSNLNLPSFSSYSQHIHNAANVAIRFNDAHTLSAALKWFRALTGMAEISLGHEVKIDSLWIKTIDQKAEESPHHLQLCDLQFGNKTTRKDPWGETVDWRSALITNHENQAEFARTVGAWCRTEGSMAESRQRILEGIRTGSMVTIDRFIGACNAFDLLPKHCYTGMPNADGETVALIAVLKEAIRSSGIKASIKERALNDVSRIKNHTLNDKINYRFELVKEHDPTLLKGAEIAIKHAVKLRNRYVHGSQTAMSEQQNERFFIFFCKLVEAIFIFSDLIECGLDIKHRVRRIQGHPLFWFVYGFPAEMAELEACLAEGR